MTESDVGNGSGAGENAEADVFAAAEAGNGLDDVVASRDFENVGAHRGLRVSGDDDGGLGLVFGARGTTSGPPDDFDGGAVGRWVGRVGGGGRLRVLGRGVGGDSGGAAAGVFFLGSLAFAVGGDGLEWVWEVVVLVLLGLGLGLEL